MFNLVYTNRFKKDIKRLQRRGVSLDAFKSVIVILEESGALPVTYKPHKLLGNYAGYKVPQLVPQGGESRKSKVKKDFAELCVNLCVHCG